MDSGAPRGLLGCLVSTHCMRSPPGRQGSRNQRLRYYPGTPLLARSGAAPAVRTPDQHQGWQARSREASCPSHWRTQHACSGPLPSGTGTVSAKERAGGVAEQEPRARDLRGRRTAGCLPRVGRWGRQGWKLEQQHSAAAWLPQGHMATGVGAPCPSSTDPKNPEPPVGTVGPQSSSLQGFTRGLPLREMRWPRLLSNCCRHMGAAPSRMPPHTTFL